MSKLQKNLLLVGLMLGVLLEGLDGMVLGTAMPRIVADLDGLKLISWVFTSYMLTSTLSTPIYGKLSDLYGRKQFYIGGMTLFMVASMLGGQSHSIEWLIFWRGVQGLGAGAMLPVASSLASDVFTGPDRGKVQGVLSGGFGISSLLGPTLGGWLTDGPGWRWAFYINVPIGLVVIAILLSVRVPRPQQATSKIQVDYFGALSLMVFTTTLLLGFVFGGDKTIGWTNPQTLGTFGVAALSLIGFLVAEKYAADPIIALSFFKNQVFVAGVIISLLIGAAMFGALSYIAYFIQGVQGNSATSSGTTITPMMIALVIGTVVGGTMITRTGKYRILNIVAVTIMSLGVLQLVLLDVKSGTLEVLVAMITIGFGIGISFPALIVALQNAFEPRFLGTISSLATFFRQIGGTIGTSLLGSVLTSELANRVSQRMEAVLPPGGYTQLTQHGFTPSVQLLTSSEGLEGLRRGLNNDSLYQGVLTALREALAGSLHTLFVAALVISLTALIATFFMKEIPLRWKAPQPESGVAEEPGQAEREVIEAVV